MTAPSAEPMPGHVEPIVVHLEESAEPEDVNDNAGAIMPLGAEDEAQDEAPKSGVTARSPRPGRAPPRAAG